MASLAQATPFEPPRGSDLRRELLDTFRPLAVYDLGAPLEFRVLELMVDEDIAFARLRAQRPGGEALDMAQTPMVEWRYADPYEFDGPRFEVFYVRDDDAWQVVTYGLGSTDVWWWAYRCETFSSLLQDYGC
ncbi:hypothetical protein [Jannaschia sp. CCS1]|uniref:hypothetical protein n=1 Tax=Jannaschia sp. (strain CCS1) TaxID=290400 RepID=UPI000680247F|nr:hypothetical protein [Jannaschia sp. CCS1]